MKIILILLIFTASGTFILAQDNYMKDINFKISNSKNLILQSSYPKTFYNNLNQNYQSKSFFNDNLNFSNVENSFYSSLKISGEIITGGATGYGLAMLMKNLIKPDKSIEGNWLPRLIQYSFIIIGATKGTSLGVYSIGKIIGDDGSYSNTYFWGVITSSLFYLVSKAFTDNLDDSLRIAMVGLPVGAVIGFNSRELFELFESLD